MIQTPLLGKCFDFVVGTPKITGESAGENFPKESMNHLRTPGFIYAAIIHVLSNSQSTPGHLLIWKKVNDHRLFAVVIHFNTTFFPKS